jgi:chaperonin GroEL
LDKRYQVFVSSTYADLIDERRRVIQTLLEMDCIPAGMELFPAADEAQLQFIKRVIDDCDYYVLIIGGRYGSTNADGVSYTEREYEYAIERGIRVLAFIHEDPDNISVGKSDIDPELRTRLAAFRRRVAQDRLVKFWKNATELPGLVALSLTAAIKQYPAVGWVRANKVASVSAADSRLLAVESPRELVIRGASLVHRAVLSAYGPNGDRIGVMTPYGPIGHKRGSAIAQNVRSSNPLENIGVDYMRRVSEQVFHEAGDFTKTALLISYTATLRGQEALQGGIPSREFVLGMQRGTAHAVEYLRSRARPVCGDDIRDIAATATTCGDQEIGCLIANAMKYAGKDGIITVETCESGKTQLSKEEGIQFDHGYLSEHFVTDPNTRRCTLDDCYLLLCDARLTDFRELLGLLERVARARKPLLVVADTVEGEALATLVVNKLRGTLPCVAVRAPASGDQRKAFLADIAVATGGKPFLTELDDIARADLKDLGRAERVIVTADKTMIIGGMGPPDLVERRAAGIRAELHTTSDRTQQGVLQQRLVGLVGALAIIRVSAPTPADVHHEMYKFESALHATRAAVEEGWVPGGGACLYHAREHLAALKTASTGEQAGVSVVSRALEEPLRTIVETSRCELAGCLREIDLAGDDGVGFNCLTGKVENLGKAGILDATKGLRVAVEVGLSCARSILTTGMWDLTRPEEPTSKPLDYSR